MGDHGAPVFALVLTADGKIAATGGKNKLIKLWDVEASKQIGVLSGHTDVIRGLAFSQDGQFLASASADERD